MVSSGDKTRTVAFILVPEFSFYALSSVSEPYRVANRLLNGTPYEILFVSLSGEFVKASNGADFRVHCQLSDLPMEINKAVIVSGFNPLTYSNGNFLSKIRELYRLGVRIGGVDTGAYLLAEAGLLKNRKCALHWENLVSFREAYESVIVLDELFVEDGRIFTSAGGAGAMDMALQTIGKEHGYGAMTAVAEQFIYSLVRDGHDRQRMSLKYRLNIKNPNLIQAIRFMESNNSRKVPISDVAKKIGISQRELTRLFNKNLNSTPYQFYRKIRLDRALKLLEQTDLSVLEIGISCGFSSASLFSRSFKEVYNMTPSFARNKVQNWEEIALNKAGVPT